MFRLSFRRRDKACSPAGGSHKNIGWIGAIESEAAGLIQIRKRSTFKIIDLEIVRVDPANTVWTAGPHITIRGQTHTIDGLLIEAIRYWASYFDVLNKPVIFIDNKYTLGNRRNPNSFFIISFARVLS